ncbi:MAG TPA: DUF6622 family protein [Devosia sp.]
MSFNIATAILTNTPLWAWGILALLIIIGVMQLRDRTMSWTRLTILPLVVLGLAISGLASVGVTAFALGGLAAGAALGIVAAAIVEQRSRPTQTKRGEVFVRGEWLTLVVLLGAFLTRYVSIVIGRLDPGAANSATFQATVMLATGAFAAFTTARAALRLRVAFQ